MKTKVIAFFCALLTVFSVGVPSAQALPETTEESVTRLIPGGMAFGVKFFTEGAIVLGTTGVETANGIESPAKTAGLRSGDIVIRAGGKAFRSAKELVSIIEGCGGKEIMVAYLRNEKEQTVKVKPARDLASGKYRIGILVKDSVAGIGTVTYIEPNTQDFGGLGHGIYDSETGLLLPLAKGTVVEVDINGITKSYKNYPGELKGKFGTVAVGELWDNTQQGVFGRFFTLPDNCQEAVPVGNKGQLKEGKAHILTTLSGCETTKYEIEIEEIYAKSGSTKNFLVHVTDKRLLDQTGGIVQGMSGSPIIQNGKLVGAVTHVLVNDPTRGYGIFIENMLNTAYDVDDQQTYFNMAA